MAENTCEGCGVCCMEQSSPPGYVYLILQQRRGQDTSGWDAQDVARVKSLPREAMRILTAYMARLRHAPRGAEAPCVWLDRETMQCKFYEHRPSICRELEVGSAGCKSWRKLYQIGECSKELASHG